MDRLSSTVTAGKAVQRSRILNDDELRRVWAAAAETPYPYGGLVRMLILTGCGLSRDCPPAMVRNRPGQEADRDRRQTHEDWQSAHHTAGAPVAYELLVSPPRFVGPCVFSASGGRSPFVGFYRAKLRLDQACGVTELPSTI